MKRLIAIVLLMVTALVAKDKPKCPTPSLITDAKFHPGQVWLYKTRAGEEKSRLTILRVESLPKPIGTVIHVRVDDIRLKNCRGGTEPDTMEHMPFTRTAIETSVTKLIEEESKIPDYQAGYEDWLNHCGGVYTITVAESIDAAEYTFNKGLQCHDMRR